MRAATLIVSTLSLACSATTLAIAYLGAKRIQEEGRAAKAKSNEAIDRFRQALENMEV